MQPVAIHRCRAPRNAAHRQHRRIRHIRIHTILGPRTCIRSVPHRAPHRRRPQSLRWKRNRIRPRQHGIIKLHPLGGRYFKPPDRIRIPHRPTPRHSNVERVLSAIRRVVDCPNPRKRRPAQRVGEKLRLRMRAARRDHHTQRHNPSSTRAHTSNMPHVSPPATNPRQFLAPPGGPPLRGGRMPTSTNHKTTPFPAKPTRALRHAYVIAPSKRQSRNQHSSRHRQLRVNDQRRSRNSPPRTTQSQQNTRQRCCKNSRLWNTRGNP